MTYVSNAFQMELTHMGLDLIVEDLNAISDSTVMLRYPDGLERESYVLLAGTIQDQVEMDKLCCEGPQLCKQCSCPKDRLHEAYARFPPRDPIAVEKAVRDAALHGRLPGDRGLPSLRPLFTQGTDPKSKRPRWFPTPACTTKVYEDTRKLLGGTHMVKNALWAAKHYNYLAQV
jgi:hypothetical protein